MNSRQKKILDLLTKAGEVSVQELSKRLDVAAMTIRRDLNDLEQQSSLIRTHGGAVIASAGIVEFAFMRKGEEHGAEKHAIAGAAAAMISPGMAITLDTGTTCLEIAKALTGVERLTVLTSSLAIASVLYARDNIDLVLLGGRARKGNPDLSGWLTEENLKHFHVDMALLGADGVDRTGVYTTDDAVARVSRGMIAAAECAVLAVDHSKFEAASFLRFAAWSDFDQVITDAGLTREHRQWLRKASKEVTYAAL